MRVVFAGTPEVAVPSLQLLLSSPQHDVVGVISRPDVAAGRGRSLVRSPVAALADEHEIEVITPRRLSDPGVLDRLRSWRADCGAVVAYGGLVPPGLLDLPTHGWINLHFSVLPAWRGAAPVQHAIAAGDEITGASTFRLEEGLDTGPVYGVITETIGPGDTSGDLLARLSDTGAHLLVSTLDGLESGDLTPVAQTTHGVSHAPKIDVDEARIRWDLPAHIVDRRVRAHTPAPGAWTTLDGARIKVGPVTPLAGDDPPAGAGSADVRAPGSLTVAKKSVDVVTATRPVRLSWVQPPGKKAMPAADWARGARLTDGTVLR
ncbi:methionyl-tRNA formyltransferase [Gordonia sp. ABSL11-1]|uniref:methionyl-tRNA formyltransferase n=1 Tax=Gordonia sp. ABSL11-1 TaxID=3053924 RepID=UPI0025731422|nr:methionyl-tRNA formyltransferase [Gordonia sp. ABSL11-1]MDL9947502.1 methionyl-tRNA formyltransferase [Gordonia sp. ABSL11-1]